MPLSTEIRWKVLNALEARPDISQRELARELGVSLGRVNYCVRALAEKGWVKVLNFSESPKKGRYLYKLTPAGITEKVALTHRFLQRKLEEHARLTLEIAHLRRDLGTTAPGATPGCSASTTADPCSSKTPD